MKVCPDCKESLPLDSFYAKKNGKLYSYCKPCGVKRAARYRYERNPEHFDEARASKQKRDALLLEGKKRCTLCREVKTLERFHKSARQGYASRCKSCKKLENQSLNHGIPVSDVVLLTQSGVCMICGKSRPLVIDHSHATGKVRGALCNSCNLGLGLLGDTLQTLESAVEYLRSVE